MFEYHGVPATPVKVVWIFLMLPTSYPLVGLARYYVETRRWAAGGGLPGQRAALRSRSSPPSAEGAGMKPKIEATGLYSGDMFLVVSFSIEQAGAVRFGTVKVPVEWLLAPQVVAAVDKMHRRLLVERWSEPELADPLF